MTVQVKYHIQENIATSVTLETKFFLAPLIIIRTFAILVWVMVIVLMCYNIVVDRLMKPCEIMWRS